MLRAYDKKDLFPQLKSDHFLPQTFVFDIDNVQFTQEEDDLFKLVDNGEWWIAKNPEGCCGRGILLVPNLTEFRNQLRLHKTQKSRGAKVAKEEFRYR